MFDLFRSRAKAVRFLLGAMLMVVALSMVITLIPGWGVVNESQDQQVVAQIGKNVITTQEVRQRMEMLLRNRSIPREMAEVYVPQLVDAMVNEQVLAYEAQRLGFRVSSGDLVQGLRVLAPYLFPNGEFIGQQAYAAALAQQNMSVAEFESSVRTQMLVSKLEDLVEQGVIVTPAEVEQEYRQRNEKIKLEYVAITPDKYRADVNVTPQEIQNYFNSSRAQFRIPEKRAFQMLVVDRAKVAQGITVPEADLRRLYDSEKDQFRTPERVNVRHILLKTTGLPEAEVAKVRAQAEDILKQLKAGANFAELAKKYSQDEGSASKGGDIGWIIRGQTVKNFEDAAFSLPVGQLSGVISTEYGFHILQVLGKEPARLKPFEEVRDQLAQEWKAQRVSDQVENLADQAHDMLVRNPNGADQVAQKLGIQVIKVASAGQGDPVPEFGVNSDFMTSIMSQPKDGVTPVMEAPGNKLVTAVVTNIFPPRPAELAEVQDQIRSFLTARKLGELVDQRAREVMEKAQAAGGDLRKAAQSMGLEVKTTQEFARNGAADGVGPATLVREGFEKPVGAVFGPVSVQESRFVCKVEDKIAPDMSKLAEQRQAITESIRSEKVRERRAMFEDSVRAALIKDGKVKVNRQVITRLAQAYSS
jgi:peptidyl-prolyl cis-trans isomerase D